MNPFVAALSLLTPFDINKAKIRLGPETDGGYVFVDDITPDQTLISYGIATECRLELEFAKRGHVVFMFDHTISGVDTEHPAMHFFREGVAGHSDESRLLYSIADHLVRHKIEGERLILKMDVEGAEFDALISTPDHVIGRFEQLIVEVHGLDLLVHKEWRERFCGLFRRLNRHFTLFHVHANNFDGPDAFDVVGGLPVPRILELSYVRTASVNRHPSQTLYPTSLDFPNTPQKDKLLWMFPFLPNTVHQELFAFCSDRVERWGAEGMTPAA
jgi:hypothetical protein